MAAVFWSPRIGAAAMCHGALPECPASLLRDPTSPLRLRYVDFSIRYLAEQICARGARRFEIQVKLFGGADVLPVNGSRAAVSVGRKNCQHAIRTLEEEGLHLAASDLGGTLGRVIYFNTETGEVFLRRLQPTVTLDALGDPVEA